MRILTWNINSVRLRLPLVKKLIRQCDPDIICLQETKTPDEHFPLQDIIDAGYPHTHIHGMKSYNGVAILSRHAFTASEIYHRVEKQDCRHIAIHLETSKFKKPVEIHCLYIPAGGDEPDPAINDKFAHKLTFVDEMNSWFSENYSKDDPLIVLGDFNIAPLEHDVWSHKQLLKVVSHTPVEVEKLTAMQGALGWQDAIRHFVPEEEKCYTWWSYRNRDWKKSNRGRRLDHIWLTAPLVPYLSGYEILTEARDWEKPSDHVPVMIDVDL
ncbi:MAG: exodeoxyribonuclease III [Rhodospirillales bacterium]|nr:exodeoxyribonuclease III [Rhodospirillales bacterium]MCB9996262.1 exodeoxyribonuclease III [Rhodospirillales bacterium]